MTLSLQGDSAPPILSPAPSPTIWVLRPESDSRADVRAAFSIMTIPPSAWLDGLARGRRWFHGAGMEAVNDRWCGRGAGALDEAGTWHG